MFYVIGGGGIQLANTVSENQGSNSFAQGSPRGRTMAQVAPSNNFLEGNISLIYYHLPVGRWQVITYPDYQGQ